MCFASSPPPPPPPPPPAAPQPVATVSSADDANRKDSKYLRNNRGRSSLRIDRTVNAADSSGSGLNIPT